MVPILAQPQAFRESGLSAVVAGFTAEVKTMGKIAEKLQAADKEMLAL